MSTKYVVTRMKGRLLSAEYTQDRCCGLSLYDDSGIVGNIYIGRVENVIKNINCAFIEIQKGVKCYYPLDDNKRHIFINRKNNTAVNSGDLMLVQVSREAIKTKPATVTSKLSLAGEYVVLSTDVVGVSISGKTKKNDNCRQLKQILCDIYFGGTDEDNVTETNDSGHDSNPTKADFGFILRTNSAGADLELVKKEAAKLVEQYHQIRHTAMYGVAWQLLYKSEPAYLKEIKDIRIKDLSEIVTDDVALHEQICNSLDESQKGVVRLYQDDLLPLYKLYSLESELTHALSKKVWLKSGGYLIIEQTEALSVIDVNTGKFVTKKNKSGSKEQSFVKTNLEAAKEIALQIRLRNLSGIIIVDFINMTAEDNNSELLSTMRKYLKQDPITASVVDITKLGLVEITRKKVGKTLSEAWESYDSVTKEVES